VDAAAAAVVVAPTDDEAAPPDTDADDATALALDDVAEK